VRAVTIRWLAQGAPGRAHHHRLGAVQHIARAVLARRGLQVGEIVAALRLGIGEGEGGLTGDDLADQLAGAGVVRLSEKATADHHRAEVGFDHQGFAELLHDHHGLGGSAAQAAKLLGEGRAQYAQLLGESLPNLRPPPRPRLHRRAAFVEVIVVGQIGGHAVAQQALFFGEAEVHGSLILVPLPLAGRG
jgi:hypothetical protein